MKTKIMDLAKLLVLSNVMVFGFFFIYAVLWVSLGLPVGSWSAAALIVLDILSVFGFYWWCSKGDTDEDTTESIAYVCDEKACEECGSNTCGECYHTTDIRHAKNFTEIGPCKFIENMEETK